MQAPDEEARLRAVRALGNAPKPQLNRITTLMKQVFGVAGSSITLIDEQLEFISTAGNWDSCGGRAGSFCDWILVSRTPEVLVVEDAREDARFCHNPHVIGKPFLRFYAGAPLVSSVQGHRYGTLCVFDYQPRSFDAAQYALLTHFAELVTCELEREQFLHLQQQCLSRAKKAASNLLRTMSSFQEGVVLLDIRPTGTWRVMYANEAFQATFAQLQAGGPSPVRASQVIEAALAGKQPTGDGEEGGQPDFWDLFELAGSKDLYSSQAKGLQAGLAALGAREEFTLHCRLRGAEGGGRGAAHAVLFRPADVGHPFTEAPAIGIPGWTPDCAAAPPSYFFAILRPAVERRDSVDTVLLPARPNSLSFFHFKKKRFLSQR